ncbi:MAG: hypothetical protein LBK52_00540 [Deltaproteobacteria bacterium]|jgi:hypothetical protein|nr:hypothetical protein [Deltaproteobacteria bacterium]
MFTIPLPIEEAVNELNLTMPLKKYTGLRDLVIILEETKKNSVAAYFAQIIGLEPAPDPYPGSLDKWQTVCFCLLEVPLIYRSIILSRRQINGREIFTVQGRKLTVLPLNMALLAAKQKSGLLAPPDDDPDPRPPKRPLGPPPKLTLVK